MKQAVMTRPGAIEINDVARPDLDDHDVLIRVERIGVCGSDVHVFHGLHPYTSYPVVQGHEVGGTISQVGAAVSGLEAGDMVTFLPQIVCGSCYPCRHGMYHICDHLKVMGFQAPGAAQEYFAVPAESIVKLPSGASAEEAAMIEPIAVAVHALERGGGARGKKVLVLGGGPIGNLTAQVARATGAESVMLTDIDPFRLQKASDCGVAHVVNPAEADLERSLDRHFGPDRADLILECVGAEATMSQAISVARKGSTIVVVGVFGKKPAVDVGLVQDRELNVVGSLMYQRDDFEVAVRLLAEGQLLLQPLITHHVPFARYLDAYENVVSGNDAMKVMIDVS
ncbi:MAG: alcohol dehydrogenase [Trueperaceae bacterium]|nr:MAG: alcohol dehydrogenase [Trueperaceae bacterium]